MKYDSVCPVCSAKSPHRRIWLLLESQIAAWDWHFTMVHLAPEAAIRRRLSGGPFGYVTGDIAPGRGDMRMDICDLSFKDGSVDFLVACHVLQALIADRKAVGEVYRVLRPGGIAILEQALAPGPTVEPRTAAERKQIWMFENVLRLYGEADYCAMLEAAGFRLIRHEFAPEMLRRCDLRQNWMYLAHKPAVS